MRKSKTSSATPSFGFGTSASSAAPSPSFGFGTPASSAAPSPSFVFGTYTSTGFGFGNPASSPGFAPSLFGSTAAAVAPASSPFGSCSQPGAPSSELSLANCLSCNPDDFFKLRTTRSTIFPITRIILGINEFGAHFFLEENSDHLFSAQLNKIRKYNYERSKNEFYMEMKLNGVGGGRQYHYFHTTEGDAILTSMKKHISFAMIQQYQKLNNNTEVQQYRAQLQAKENSLVALYRSSSIAHVNTLQDLRSDLKSIKQEILEVEDKITEEFSQLGKKSVELGDYIRNYHDVLIENRTLLSELQELKGSIRVYCRVKPASHGKKSVVEDIGERGELVVRDPTKSERVCLRRFRFNKVYGEASTQADVFMDIKPFVRSVMDGYNACIFAYGQTGSGKTYTMTGLDGASKEKLGVINRAVSELFRISGSRKGIIDYDVSVQMIEIYNEQVHDLLSSGGSEKNLAIQFATQQKNGLAVPDARLCPVKSTSDVIKLMKSGLQNRAVGSTALNERSSRSHSIVTVHVCGIDLKTGSVMRGNLRMIDLAGSERVKLSGAQGDTFTEATYINKSLLSLGDVICALASKRPHVPYRNSKLTELLQSSLGGRAKVLMLVHISPEATSYSETISSLKFAERVSNVALGHAKSNIDEGEQIRNLNALIMEKDNEIARLRLLTERSDKIDRGSSTRG